MSCVSLRGGMKIGVFNFFFYFFFNENKKKRCVGIWIGKSILRCGRKEG